MIEGSLIRLENISMTNYFTSHRGNVNVIIGGSKALGRPAFGLMRRSTAARSAIPQARNILKRLPEPNAAFWLSQYS